MTTTRPGVAVKPARSRFAERDEYPALGVVAVVVPRTGLVMGPTPRVHLGNAAVRAAVVQLPLAAAPASPVSSYHLYNDAAPAEPPWLDAVPGHLPAEVVPLPAVSVASEIASSVSVAATPVEEPVRADASRWKPVDPQSARAVLRVEREVEIPRERHHTRRPRPPQLSSGDATERMQRLVTTDRRRRVVLVAATVLVVVALLGSIWRYTTLGYAAQPATTWNQVALPDSTVGTPVATPSISASASASAAPSTAAATPSSTPTEDVTTAQPTKTAKGSKVSTVLTANAIYGEAITGACPAQTRPTNADEARAALTAYVNCMNSIWSPVIEAGKIRFREASVYFYVNTIVNPCTTLHTSDPVTAMYCPMDATIYVSPTGVASAIGSTFYGAELVTHEYSHHVQSLSQILTYARDAGWSDSEYSRRVQLQAHCLSFAVINHVDGFAPNPAIFRVGWQVGPGSSTYGSIASIQYWGEKGLAATKVGDCDTYSVPASSVA